MALDDYRRKRNFAVTPEPAGGSAAVPGASFVVQKHAASRLHYDLRLEMDGVLWSWAVPKGPSLDPAEKRLAVHVEDHPLEYRDFEGIIPKGEYGGGTMLVWDRGTWHPVGDPWKGYRKGHLEFELDGERLRGRWHLVRTFDRRAGEDPKTWLWMKVDDEAAVPGSGDAVLREHPGSVLTGRTLEEIAGAPKAAPQAPPPPREPIPGARPAHFPARIAPQLATTAVAPPDGDTWIHELRLDGVRLLASARDGEIRLRTRDGEDWTGHLAPVAAAVARLPVQTAWLDGVVTVLQPNGATSLQALQDALAEGRPQDLVYFAFDLLYLDGDDLRGAALLHRKQTLATLLRARPQPALRLSDHVQGAGVAFYNQACRLPIRGIVSKRGDLPYRSGRSRGWVTVECAPSPVEPGEGG